MGTLPSFSVTVVSTATPEQVYARPANGADRDGWAGPFVPASRWERKGAPPPGGVGAVPATWMLGALG
jgi:hypothetical protein